MTQTLTPAVRSANRSRPVACGLAIEVRRTSTTAAIRLTGPLTEPVRRQLADTLHWVIATGARQVAVHLATAEQIDAGLLQLLRDARTHLDGLLVVTAGRPELRLSLRLVGLDDRGEASARAAASS